MATFQTVRRRRWESLMMMLQDGMQLVGGDREMDGNLKTIFLAMK